MRLPTCLQAPPSILFDLPPGADGHRQDFACVTASKLVSRCHAVKQERDGAHQTQRPVGTFRPRLVYRDIRDRVTRPVPALRDRRLPRPRKFRPTIPYHAGHVVCHVRACPLRVFDQVLSLRVELFRLVSLRSQQSRRQTWKSYPGPPAQKPPS